MHSDLGLQRNRAMPRELDALKPIWVHLHDFSACLPEGRCLSKQPHSSSGKRNSTTAPDRGPGQGVFFGGSMPASML
jgi:hypothetical protein